MAKKQTTAQVAGAAAAAAVQALERGGDAEITLEEGGADLAEEIRALRELDSGGTDIEWTVEKEDGPPEDRGFIEKLSSAMLDMQRFRDVYGPGRYRVTGRRSDTNTYVKSKRVTISRVGYKSPTAPLAAPVAPAPASFNPDKVLAWVAALTPLATPLLARIFAPPRDLAETLQALKALKELDPPPPKPESVDVQLDRMAGMLVKMRELTASDGNERGTTWLDLGLRALDTLKDPLSQAARVLLPGVRPPLSPSMPSIAAPVQMASVPQPSSPAPASAQPIASQPGSASGSTGPSSSPGTTSGNGSADMLGLLGWFRGLVADLIPKAQRNSNPALYAEVVLDNLPEGTGEKDLLPFLERPTWWEDLKVMAPGVAPYQTWFTDFRREVLGMVKTAQVDPPQVSDAAIADDNGGDHDAT